MAKSTSSASAKVPLARKQFLSLLLANPNHFKKPAGKSKGLVESFALDTTYEELKCVGFNPELSRLEGVVWIKQSSGFSGGICTNGSQEYVSFFLSYDDGATWLPQGIVNFTVYDVAGPHPLEYAVSLPIQPDKTLCFFPNLPLVRAILSWQVPPTGPAYSPVWGNSVDTRIQVPGYWLDLPFPVLLDAAKLQLPPDFAAIVAPDATIKLQAPKALSAAELKAQYAKSAVPPHRFLQSHIQKALANPATLAASSAYFNGLGFDLAAILAALDDFDGDTNFEQLECIGLEEGDGGPDALVGTLVIKLPTGYLGSPCFAGSREYVAFWIDWGAGWEWSGTPSTNVHDIAAIPKEGLSFAVYQPVNLNSHRKPCQQGPVTAKVRAILSWDSPPPSNDPDYVPVWGNRVETTIFVNPGLPGVVGDFTPYISTLCGVDPCDIDQTSGWAHPGAGDRPFGGAITIYGSIPGTLLFADPPPAALPRYKVEVTNLATLATQVLTDPFTITIQKQVGGAMPTSAQQVQTAPSGLFTYQQMTPSAAGWNIVSLDGLGGGQNPLAVWNSVAEGLHRISVTAYDSAMTPFAAGSFLCAMDGTTRQSVVVDLDQKPPMASLHITGYKPGGVGPCIAAVDCATFAVGDVICGTYLMSDEHMGSFSLTAEPTASPGSNFAVDGVAGNGEAYPAIPVTTTSKSGVWTYDTAGLPPCGYTIQLWTGDRTIVSCFSNWENNANFVGFCLVAAKK